MIYQNINSHKGSVSELIINKSYKKGGRRQRSKLLLSTHINYQRWTLVKGLFKPCYEEFYAFTYCVWFCTEYPYLQTSKGSFRNDYIVSLS